MIGLGATLIIGSAIVSAAWDLQLIQRLWVWLKT